MKRPSGFSARRSFDCEFGRFLANHYSFFSAGASPSFFSAGASPSFFSPPAAASAPAGAAEFFIFSIIAGSGMLVFGGGLPAPAPAPAPPPPPSPQPIANATMPHPSNIANFFIIFPLLFEVLRRPTRRLSALVLLVASGRPQDTQFSPNIPDCDSSIIFVLQNLTGRVSTDVNSLIWSPTSLFRGQPVNCQTR